MAELVDGRVEHEIVRGALVAEALALEVHLEPGLRGHPHHAVDHLAAGKRVGRQRAAVEQHGSMDVVECGTRPDAGLDAVALGTGDAGVEGEDELGLRLECREHLVVEGIAAGADAHALSSVDAHVAVGALGDDARHAAGLVLLKLDHGAAVAELDAVVGGVRLEDLAVLSRAAVLHASVAGCPVAVLHLVGILVEVMVGAVHKLAAGLLAQVAVPLNRLGRLVCPQAKQLGIDVGGGVHGHLAADVERLDVGVVGKLVLGADGAKGTANARAHLVLLDDENLRAVLGGRAGSEKAGGTCANNKHVAVERLDDVALSDLGCGAEPCGGVGGLGRRGLVGKRKGRCAGESTGSGGRGDEAAARDVRGRNGHGCFPSHGLWATGNGAHRGRSAAQPPV